MFPKSILCNCSQSHNPTGGFSLSFQKCVCGPWGSQNIPILSSPNPSMPRNTCLETTKKFLSKVSIVIATFSTCRCGMAQSWRGNWGSGDSSKIHKYMMPHACRWLHACILATASNQVVSLITCVEQFKNPRTLTFGWSLKSITLKDHGIVFPRKLHLKPVAHSDRLTCSHSCSRTSAEKNAVINVNHIITYISIRLQEHMKMKSPMWVVPNIAWPIWHGTHRACILWIMKSFPSILSTRFSLPS